MKSNHPVPELLCPAGSEEALHAAVDSGADAVYLGTKAFGARASAVNFDDETLARAVEYAHLHHVRVHVTVNTLVKEKEFSGVRETLRAIQTPQVFDADLIRAALQKAAEEGAQVTDDCSCVERMGMKVSLTRGSKEALKLTTPFDLLVARAILEARGRGEI